MATAAHPAPAVEPSRFTPGRVVAIVLGSLGAIVGIGLLIGGLVLALAHLTLRDADGFYMSSTERLTTNTRAITSEGLDIGVAQGAGVEWAADAAPVRVRVRASSADGRPIFVGIAPARALGAYLRGVAHEQVTAVHSHPFSVETVRRPGVHAPGAPAGRRFWVATATGRGTQTAEWKVGSGRWAVVVMNADGRAGVAADVGVGASAGWLVWVGLGLVVVGLMSVAGGGGVLWAALRPAARADGGSGTSAGEPGAIVAESRAEAAAADAATRYPVRVEARLDEPLSRWLWLVKWLLALPHWIALGFLWLAVDVLWLVALVAVVATGRYPRAIFDFNVGVLRWTWRVGYYALGGIGTDRYPPFSLEPTDYPAELDIPYPERLSRGRALVKWWLLALPHYVIVGIFLGWWSGGTPTDGVVGAPGLLPVLVVIAGAVLLVTGRYPRELFELVVGISRWVLRVAAYALLMRDEYPPFRLGR